MARRKRLTPPRPDFLASEAPAPAAGPLSMPPIAQVAGEAASAAALQNLSDEMAKARSEGRFIEALPLEAVEATYLVRDRIGVSDEEQTALIASLRARGQQTPIEVVDLGEGRYGLIAGWRRLMALKALHEETGAARFARIDARITRPGESSEAYRAMVEENEIRVGLSHYERARIAVRAVQEGVFDNDRAALNALYSSASRAKKSKIGSFIGLVQALDGSLSYPTAIGERLGLSLAKRLSEDPDFARDLHKRLTNPPVASAEAEQQILQAALHPTPSAKDGAPPDVIDAGAETQEEAGITVTWSSRKGEIRLTGTDVDAALAEEIKAWLAVRSA